MTTPINLYWFTAHPNFGDRISAEIVAQVSGRPVQLAEPEEADLFALGSIMKTAAKVVKRSQIPVGPCIWGTGVIGFSGPELLLDRVQLAAVRGPLSLALLDAPEVPLGDPGLLIADVLPAPQRSGKIGIVLHLSEKPEADLVKQIEDDGRFTFIDVTDPDHLGVVRQIASCAHVVSSSLHGLIVADAYGVPNSWMVNARIHTGGAFKFHDYGLSIRRLMNEPVRLEQVIARADAGEFTPDTPAHFAAIPALRDGLRAAFPHQALALRQEAREGQVAR